MNYQEKYPAYESELEFWTPVVTPEVDYTGYYEVSNFGRVRGVDRIIQTEGRSNFTKKGKVLKLMKDSTYLRINLSKEKSYKKYSIHFLVYCAFKEFPKYGNHVHHRYHNRDNRVASLQELTPRQNASIERTLKSGLPVGVSKLANGKFLAKIRNNGKQIHLGEYEKMYDARLAYGIALHIVEDIEDAMLKRIRASIDIHRNMLGITPVKYDNKNRPVAS